jgi:hypothetical protein
MNPPLGKEASSPQLDRSLCQGAVDVVVLHLLQFDTRRRLLTQVHQIPFFFLNAASVLRLHQNSDDWPPLIRCVKN